MSVRRLSFAWLGLLLAISTTPGFAVDYGKDIAPLWKRSCVACHNSKKAEGGLNLESGANLLKESDSGVPVVAGKSGESELLARITATDDTIMPPKDNSAGAKPLTPAEIELVKQWIDAGAVPSEEGIPTTIAWQAVPGSIRPVYAVDASADGQFIAAGRGNQVVVYTWPLKTAQPAAVALIDPQTASSAGAPAAHLDLVQSLAFSPDAQTLVTGGYRCVKFWRRDFAPTSLAALQSSAGIIAASPSGKSLAMARDDKTVEIIDLATKTVKFVLPAAQGKIGTIAWTLDDQALFVADESKTVTRWQLPAADAPATTAPTATSFAAPTAIKALAPLARDRVALLSVDGQVSLFVEEAPATPAPEAPAAAAPAAAAEKPADEKPAPAPPATPAAGFVKKDFAEAIPAAADIAVCPGEPVRLLVALSDGQVRAVHAVEGKTLATWKSPVAVTRIAAHPQGTQVATLGADGTIRVWNPADGKEVIAITPETSISRDVARAQRTVARQQAEVDRLAASIKELETAHQKEQEAMKKVAEEREKAAKELAAKVADIDGNVAAIKESEKGIEAAKAMIAEQMKKIEQLTADIEAKKKKEPDLEKAKQTAMEGVQKQDQALASAKDAVDRAAKAIPERQAVVETNKEKLVSFQGAATALEQQAKASREDAAVGLVFNQAGNALVLGRKQGSIAVIDVAAGGVAAELKPAPQLGSVAAAGPMIVAASASSPLIAWSSQPSWKLERVIGSETDPNSVLSDRVTALAFSPDGQTLAVGSGPASRFGDVKLFNANDGTLVRDLGEVHSDTVLDIAFSPDGQQLATCGADKLIRVFEAATGKQRLSLEGHTHHVLSIAWQDSGRTLASASADATLKVWDTISGEQQRTVSGFGKEITSLAFVGQTGQVLASCADNSLRLVETSNGSTVRTFGGSASSLYALCVTPDGKDVVAGGQDGKLGIWTIADGKVVKQLD